MRVPVREMKSDAMRVLTFTTLYPSSVRPRHGIFVEARLRELRQRADVDVRVVAPVPWFPFTHPRFGEYSRFARTPSLEERGGISVAHPRYAMLPGVGMYFQPYALALGAHRSVRSLLRAGFDFDLIDAHYVYPDGVAAALLGRFFGRPVVITARGTDVNLLPSYAIPRSLILWAARQARAVVTVSDALRTRLETLGVEPGRLHVVRNGVDAQIFRPHSQTSARRALGLPDGILLLSVGNLVPEKGHELVISALGSIPGAHLAIVGEGPQRERLVRLAATAGVGDRVSFLAVLPQNELAEVYSAADVLVLASSREGWPNVLLEAMACGTPVAATDVGGVREIVAAPEAGRLLRERTPAAIARAVLELTSNPPHRTAVRAYAERFGWDSACRELVDLFHRVTAASRGSPSARAGATV